VSINVDIELRWMLCVSVQTTIPIHPSIHIVSPEPATTSVMTSATTGNHVTRLGLELVLPNQGPLARFRIRITSCGLTCLPLP
jgi:hypothetical protein